MSPKSNLKFPYKPSFVAEFLLLAFSERVILERILLMEMVDLVDRLVQEKIKMAKDLLLRQMHFAVSSENNEISASIFNHNIGL